MKRKNPNNSEAGLAKVSDAITVREAGARGGRSTLERRGIEFFREIGAKGGRRQKELYAHLLCEFGKKGGRPRRPSLEDSMGEESLQMKEDGCIGIVVVEEDITGDRKAYIGPASGTDEKADTQQILAWGNMLRPYLPDG